MGTKTTRLGLNKPAQEDFYNVDEFNENMDKIDEEFGEHEDKTVVSEAGVHGFRYYNNKQQVFEDGQWRDTQIFAVVKVNCPTGSIVKATHDNHTRVATSVDGSAYVEVNYRGKWDFVATYQEGTSETITRDIQSNDDVEITPRFAVIHLNIRWGTTVTTCTGVSYRLSISNTQGSPSTEVDWYMPGLGTYTINTQMYGFNCKTVISVTDYVTYGYSYHFHILGLQINENSTENENACTYLYDATWVKDLYDGNITNTSLFTGSILGRCRPFARNSSGKIVPLSRDNYTVQDSTVTGYDPNYQVDITSKDEVFLFVPKIAMKETFVNGIRTFVFTNHTNVEGFNYKPFSLDEEGDCDGIGIAVYPTATNYPYSYSGKYLTNANSSGLTTQQIIDKCNARGNRFGQLTYWQWRMWVALVMLGSKKKAWGGHPGGYVSGYTTGTANTSFNASCEAFGNYACGKTFGLENIMGYYGTVLDGLIRVSATSSAVTIKERVARNGTYKQIVYNNTLGNTESGWVKNFDTAFPGNGSASSSTYYRTGANVVMSNNSYYNTNGGSSAYQNLAFKSMGSATNQLLSARPVIYFKKGEWKLW